MIVALSLLSACDQPSEAPAAEAPAGEAVPMDAARLLTRASLDVRGVRPTLAELDRVEADPDAVDAMITEFVDDPRFGDRVADLFSEVYLTRTESYQVRLDGFGLDDVSPADILGSVGDEPLQMLAEIAREDLPVTELVTGDWTMADDVLARMYPVDYPAGATGWQRVHYTDSRPAAGVLATNGLWWRYQSTDSNANRGRANVASRILLCHDYLTRPIEFDRNVNLLDEAAISDALRSNPGCVNCHASLDPLAAYFFGFSYYEITGSEIASYHPSRERNWTRVLGTPPSYYGEPGDDLGDLGRQIASDARFPQCMVEHVTELLLRRDLALVDTDRLTEHREALIQGGMKLRPLFESVMRSPEYGSATAPNGTEVPLKLVTPALLASEIRDLTGFDWTTVEGYDLLQSDAFGFLSLAGGADGVFTTSNARSPNSTLLLVQERLAEAASDYVVGTDAADRSAAKLFTEVDFTETPETGREAMVAQIQRLHRRIFGHEVAADGPEVEANLGLWSDLYAVDDDIPRCWAGLLSALLRDPDFLLY
ncbi:MAG: hypothetical protein R3F59_12305 [Myxococcota bacterium]